MAPATTTEQEETRCWSTPQSSACTRSDFRPWPTPFVELQNTRDAAELSREDWLGLLLDREVTHRENRKLTRRLRAARLRQAAVVEDVDFRAPRGLDRGLFQKLTTCHWIRDHQHLAVVGPTGIGKSWIACALGHKACREGFSVLYKRTPRLFRRPRPRRAAKDDCRV